jgi:allantoin racemase
VHLRIVTPIVSTDFGLEALEDLRAVVRPTTHLDMVFLDQGPPSIEVELDEALAIPDTLRRVLEAAEEGCDAVVLNCMGDPGLAAARELVPMLVIGPGLAGMHLASMLGARFCVIVARARGIAPMEALVARYGLRDRLASVRALEIPVLELEHDQGRLVEALFVEARQAIRDDGANVILLGSTGMIRIGPLLSHRLAEVGTPAPVVDPLLAALTLAEVLAAMGLTHHRHPDVAASAAAGAMLVRALTGKAQDDS